MVYLITVIVTVTLDIIVKAFTIANFVTVDIILIAFTLAIHFWVKYTRKTCLTFSQSLIFNQGSIDSIMKYPK